MDLKEHEGRALFIKHGITVPRGFIMKDASGDDSRVRAETLLRAFLHGAPGIKRFALKAQLLSGKRGKGGGIVFAELKNFIRAVEKLRDKTVNGEKVKEVLAVEALDIAKEYYLAVTVDRSGRCPVIIFSDCGGIDIEETAENNPPRIIKVAVKDLKSFPENEIRTLAEKHFGSAKGRAGAGDAAGVGAGASLGAGAGDAAGVASAAENFAAMAKRLFILFRVEDCLLAEINPLILTKDGKLYAADAKITVDDSSVYRHPKMARFLKRGHSTLESEASKYGLSYVELGGDLAVIGNGAGLVMSTLDAVKHFGAEPANFCDLGGGASEMMVEKAMEIVLQKKSAKSLFINIFGGITRCDEVARGIVRYIKARKEKMPPTVVRLSGTNETEGLNMLAKAGIKAYTGFSEAARAAS